MSRLDSEEETRLLLRKAFTPAPIPQDFKDRLREQLRATSVSTRMPAARPLWSRPQIMIPVMASVTGGLIGYGAWVSWHLVTTMVP